MGSWPGVTTRSVVMCPVKQVLGACADSLPNYVTL